MDLDDRVNKCKNLAKDYLVDSSSEEKIKAATKIQAYYRGYLTRRAIRLYLDSSSKESSDVKSSKEYSSAYDDEDEEVKNIMGVQIIVKQESEKVIEESKKEENKSYERLLATQMKMKIKQQSQLNELRAKDLQEMNKLAEALGGNQEMKESFHAMINRRYSKLVHLFEENIESIKQVLGCGELAETNLMELLSENLAKNPEKSEKSSISEKKTPVEDLPLPSLRNTISEFSSSFLDQLKGVPNNVPTDLTFEPILNDIKEDYIDSPEELSVYSRDTCTEPPEANISFPSFHNLDLYMALQDEPNIPLISESFIDNSDSHIQEKSEQGALISLVGEIKEDNKREEKEKEEESDNTLNLNEDKTKKEVQASPIFIYEESFSSNESGVLAEYSSILASPAAESNHEPVSEVSKSKPLRNINETFPHKEPSHFTATLESSTEHDGYELIINRVLLTLELHVFSIMFEEILSDTDFLSTVEVFKLEKKSKIPIKGLDSFLSMENQVQTDQIGVLSFIHKLQAIKPSNLIIDKIMTIYDPLQMLSMIQENFEGIEEDTQVFDYQDLEDAEKSSNLSEHMISSASEVNLCIQIHNKMIVDVLNEAILRSAKHKLSMPWSLEHQFNIIKIENLMKSAIKKIFKWCEVEAGKVPSSDMITSNGELDEDKLQMIREEKLAQILTVDVDEGDKSWLDFEYEESQVAIDIADYIISGLYLEVIDIII